jgi:hypothetical protein
VGEPGAWGEVTAGLSVSRPVLVARLLELDAAGALTTAHVRAGAQVGGVSVRTVWRWLEAARTEGRVEPRPRARLELSDQAWEVLAQAGGNVAVLHRLSKEAAGEVPSLASLHRVVRRDLQAGRVLPDRAVVRREREEQQTRQALADLALAGTREGGAAKAAAAVLQRAHRDHRGPVTHQSPRLGGLREQVQGRDSDEDPAVRERLQRARGGRDRLARAGR